MKLKKVTVPTEEEIISRLDVDWSKPLVTFLCITYNQQDYIEDTLIGFLRQKTSFPYEILIHDDCSSDNTRKLIDSYKAKYPRLIKTIYQKQNQYSQGNSVALIAAKQARAEYIALCEGDDYWINDNKTENQLRLMLADPSITMVVSSGKAQYGDKISSNILGSHGNEIKQISAQYILDSKGSLAPTASYIVKKEFLIKSRELFKDAPVGDLFIELYNAVYGKLIYYPEVVCVYRKMAKNSWSSRMGSNLASVIQYTDSFLETINNTKSIEGFETLDWSTSISNTYFNLAFSYFNHNKFHQFQKNIKLSNKYKELVGKKKVLYTMGNNSLVPTRLILMSAFFYKKIKRFCNY